MTVTAVGVECFAKSMQLVWCKLYEELGYSEVSDDDIARDIEQERKQGVVTYVIKQVDAFKVMGLKRIEGDL